MSLVRRSSEETPTIRQAVLGGTLFGWLAFGVALVSGLVATPLLLDHLGPRDYGLWALLQSLASYAALSDLGASQAISHLLARARGSQDSSTREALVRAALRLYGALALAVLVVGFVLAGRVSIQGAMHKATVVLLALATAITLLAVPAMSLLNSERRLATVHQARTAGSILYLLGVIATVHRSLGLVGVAASFLASQTTAASYAVWRTFAGFRRTTLARSLSGTERRQIFGLGAQYFLNALGWQLIVGTDGIVIAAFVGLTAVAQYAPLLRVSELLGQGVLVGLTTLQPLLAEAAGRGATDSASRIYIDVAKGGALAAAVVLAGMLAFGEPVLLAWVGERGYPGFPVLVAMAVFMALRIVSYASGTILGGIGEMRAMSVTALAEGVLNLVLSLWLVQEHGLLGVALGSLIAHAAIGGWVLPLTACRKTATPARQYIQTVTVRPLLAFLVMAVPTGAAAAMAGGPKGLDGWSARILLYLILCVAAVGVVGMDRGERQRFLTLLRG